jgi:hypothetical protein
MTILSGGTQLESSTPPSTSIAIAGIVSAAVVIGILAVSTACAIIRRNPKHNLTRSVLHDDSPEVKSNPIRAPPQFERQRSMTFPPPDPDTMTRMNFAVPVINNTAQRNPFAPKTKSMAFSPVIVRTDLLHPPPPPPLEEDV